MGSGALAIQRSLTPLQERFIKSGLEGFDSQEIVELLLTLGSPRKDCKPQAKECIVHFKSLRRLLAASSEELQRVGISPSCRLCIKLLHELPTTVLKEKIMEQPIYQSSKEVFDYLYYSMRDLKKEVFKVIYLNSQNQIIDTADLFEGTVNTSVIHPREVIEGALKHNAVSLIFVHNHPSGNPKPSQSDKDVTRDLVYAGSIMQIKVLDHIIIGDNTYFSFAGEGLIEEYEGSFLNLKIRGTLDLTHVKRRNKVPAHSVY